MSCLETSLHTAERNIELRITWPQGLGGKVLVPVVIWSHGLGGNKRGYEFLTQSWASIGIASIKLTHKGSDTGALFTMGPSLATSPLVAASRMKDISEIVENLSWISNQLPITLDPNRIGLGGHSFGAWTALASSGRLFIPFMRQFQAPLWRNGKLVAIISASPPPPSQNAQVGNCTEPVLVLTGTEDSIPEFTSRGLGTDWGRRLETFELLKGGIRCLGIINGANHTAFANGAGSALVNEQKPTAEMVNGIAEITTLWWSAFLLGNQAHLNRIIDSPQPFPQLPSNYLSNWIIRT